MIRLHDHELSGNCYKVRLLLSLLGRQYERVPIDLYPAFENHDARFLALNPLGEVPVLEDGGFILSEPHAMLVYLSSLPGTPDHWHPRTDPASLGRTAQWLEFATRLSTTIGAARDHDTLQVPGDVESSRRQAHALLRILDRHLWFCEQEHHPWLLGAQPGIADVACFPYVILSDEGGISRLPYPAVNRWTDRIKRLPGFVPMSGVFPTSPALNPGP